MDLDHVDRNFHPAYYYYDIHMFHAYSVQSDKFSLEPCT